MAKCIRFIHIVSSEFCMESRIVSLHVFVRMHFKSGLLIYFFFTGIPFISFVWSHNGRF